MHASEVRTGYRTETLFQIPPAPILSLAENLHPDRSLGLAMLRILVVEDDDDARVSIEELLEVEGHEVILARDGFDAVEKTRSAQPDLVLCDIGLPGVDGCEVARTIRADPTLRTTRLIALTGYVRPEDVARGILAGFDAYLLKPLDLDELRRAIA